MPKIPQHNTPRGTWCRFSGTDSTSGICRMCEPRDDDAGPVSEPAASSYGAPSGWGVLEYAESRAREALATWDSPAGGLYLHRGMALAEATRQLLAELDAERRMRTTR